MRIYLSIGIACLLASCSHILPKQESEAELAQKKLTNLEQFKFSIPQGWKIAHKTGNEEQTSKQIINAKETLDNWTIMITAQTFFDSEKYEPEKFINQMGKDAQKYCGSTHLFDDKKGVQDGFKFSQKMLTCLPNKKTLQNERKNIKAIKGKEAFYVVEVAYRTQLNRDEAFYWIAYLSDVTVVKK